MSEQKAYKRNKYVYKTTQKACFIYIITHIYYIYIFPIVFQCMIFIQNYFLIYKIFIIDKESLRAFVE